MKPIERVRIALEGGKPDRLPVFPIYDYGYMLAATGRDVREWTTAPAPERIRLVEDAFLLHEVDGYFVHFGTNGRWARRHRVERREDHWLVTNRRTGDQFRLLSDGSHATVDGSVIPRDQSAGGVSRIKNDRDISRYAAAARTRSEIARSGQFDPLRRLLRRYPDHHFSVQVTTPMVRAIQACGGFVEGLVTLATDRGLYARLLQHFVEGTIRVVAAAKSAGAHSIYYTSYYAGADTISPGDYEELVFPVDEEICAAAKQSGLYVLHWYLGDLMPNLDAVSRLPTDALVLEQGRKGYSIDPVEIRRRLGPERCIFGFGIESDYIEFRKESISAELKRQFEGAGSEGAFVAGTPIMPPDADPRAVDFYFSEARRIGGYE